MRPFRELQLNTGFLLISVLMVVIGQVVYSIPDQQKKQGEWVAHTHEVLNQLGVLSNHLTDAESGQRGYLLTGEVVGNVRIIL